MHNAQSPTMLDSVKEWNWYLPKYRMICVLSATPETVKEHDQPIVFGMPYFWIGIIPKELAAFPDSKEAHAAILIISEDGAYTLLHSLASNKYFREVLTEEQFAQRSLYVYRILNPNVKWQPLP